MKSIRCWGPIVCIFACSPLQSLQHNAFLTAARLRVNCLSTRISRQIDTSVWRSAGESNGTNTLISSWVIVSAVNRWESHVDDTIMWREACGHQLKPVVERGKPWGEHVGFDIQNPAAFHWSRCCFTLIWPQSCTSFRLTDVKIFRRNKTCFVSFKEQGFCLQKRLWIMMQSWMFTCRLSSADGPVTVGMSLDIASIDTISEINMVRNTRHTWDWN